MLRLIAPIVLALTAGTSVVVQQVLNANLRSALNSAFRVCELLRRSSVYARFCRRTARTFAQAARLREAISAICLMHPENRFAGAQAES